MRIRQWTAVVSLGAVAFAGFAQESMAPKVVPIKPNATFERMKTLAGEWEGTNGRGLPARLSYRITSGGTLLLETLLSKENNGQETEMTTAYHVDGDRIMMTHYCMNTQPRLTAATFSGNEIQFIRKDITNYPGAPWGAMRAMKLTIVSNDTITQHWTWYQDGKDLAPELFQFTRKK